jgi:multimeric flavodoxin WrbA
MGELMRRQKPEIEFQSISLVNSQLQPCTMCADCLGIDRCAHDPAFNELFDGMVWADGILLVVPHYALIPAKLTIVLEKLQEFAFLHGYNKLPGDFILAGKPVGLVAHGGMVESEDVIKYYQRALLEPVSNALKGIGMQVVPLDGGMPLGVVFGIRRMIEVKGRFLPEFEHAWPEITERLSLLTGKMLEAIGRDGK